MAEYKVLIGIEYDNPDDPEGEDLRAEPGDVIDFEPAEWLIEQYIVEAVTPEEVAPAVAADVPEADANPLADEPHDHMNPDGSEQVPTPSDPAQSIQSAPVTSKVV